MSVSGGLATLCVNSRPTSPGRWWWTHGENVSTSTTNCSCTLIIFVSAPNVHSRPSSSGSTSRTSFSWSAPPPFMWSSATEDLSPCARVSGRFSTMVSHSPPRNRHVSGFGCSSTSTTPTFSFPFASQTDPVRRTPEGARDGGIRGRFPEEGGGTDVTTGVMGLVANTTVFRHRCRFMRFHFQE